MTKEEAKEQAAKLCGFKSMNDARNWNARAMEHVMDTAMVLYAEAKWNESRQAVENKVELIGQSYRQPQFRV